jgi:hypothetical protein
MKQLLRGALVCCAIITSAATSQAQQSSGLKPNQTLGYGDGQLLTFTYGQSFACVDQPRNDLDFNGVKAQSDPNEFQIPICQAGINPTINPPGQNGKATATTDPIYVLIPMFSVNDDQNADDAISCTGVVSGTLCGAQLGQALIQFFGAVPEAFKTTPLVYTQCPDPGLPAGTCTMHGSRVDLSLVLAALGKTANPPTSNVFVPLPNHSHVLRGQQINQTAEWWQVLPVLVMNKSDWPAQNASSGITSKTKMDAAIKAGRAIEVASNFFLYFSSQQAGAQPMTMNMNMSH